MGKRIIVQNDVNLDCWLHVPALRHHCSVKPSSSPPFKRRTKIVNPLFYTKSLSTTIRLVFKTFIFVKKMNGGIFLNQGQLQNDVLGNKGQLRNTKLTLMQSWPLCLIGVVHSRNLGFWVNNVQYILEVLFFTQIPIFCEWTTLIKHQGQLRIRVNFVCYKVAPCLKRHFEVDPD